jgi:hypothetical protein
MTVSIIVGDLEISPYGRMLGSAAGQVNDIQRQHTLVEAQPAQKGMSEL